MTHVIIFILSQHTGQWLMLCRTPSNECKNYITHRYPLQKNPRKLHHDDVIKWKHFPRNWPYFRGIHRSPVNSPHKGQWRRALMFSLICVWIDDWVSNREAGDLSRYRAHYDAIVMSGKMWADSTVHAVRGYIHSIRCRLLLSSVGEM